jgi:thiamine biosynthesis lipoprotein
MRKVRAAIAISMLALSCGPGDAKQADESPGPSPATQAAPEPGSAIAAEDTEAPPVRKDGTILAESVLMNTPVRINVWLDPGLNAGEAGKAIAEAFDEMARLEAVLSEWQSTSAVSALNQAAGGEAISIPRELFEVLEVSRQVSEQTDGSFDVTFHGVGSLWKFDPGSKPPSKEAVQEKLPLVDYRKVEIDASKLTGRLATAGMQVGLGAVAKGYIVDAASNVLKKHGFQNHIVEGGGDTFVSGHKGDKSWVVGIQDPKKQGAVGRVTAKDRAVVTSGNYERFFEHEGTRYAHILDPRTGWPLPYDESPRSVTIVADDTTRADAFATAVTVMGTERGFAFIEATETIEGVVIGADGTVKVSAGLQEHFTPIGPAGRP